MPPVLTPTAAYAERWMLAKALIDAGEVRTLFRSGVPVDATDRWQRRLRAVTAWTLCQASPVVWRHEMRMAACGLKVPPHQVEERPLATFPSVMWWTFETWAWTETKHGIFVADGMLVIQQPKKLILIEVGQSAKTVEQLASGKGELVLRELLMKTGVKYPDDYPEEGQDGSKVLFGSRHHIGHVLGMISFMNSPFIRKETRLPERPLRKQARKIGVKDEEMAMSVVRLRRRRADTTPREADEDKADDEGRRKQREFHYQWMVSGHHRAQWYPSRKEHRLIFIAPYVKGPADKPLKTRVYRVER